MRVMIAFLTLAILATACSPPDLASTTTSPDPSSTTSRHPTAPSPPIPLSGDLDQIVAADLDALFASISGDIDRDAIRRIGAVDDVRVAWLLADLLRFLLPGSTQDDVVVSFESITGFTVSPTTVPWVAATNLLIGWDTPAPPGYVDWKRQLFVAVDPRWEPFFDGNIDYRLLSWGGVRPDDRPLGAFDQECVGGCIPALDDPAVTNAEGGDWYRDQDTVFGIAINGEARAYPKNIMEIHEMVIDTVGGVRIGMPYCTLCGSAQAYDLASVPDGVDPPLLRTSGLLIRSNKLMFDLNTYSAFDTFTGVALSGPMLDADVALDQITVVVTSWSNWKTTYPQTTIIAEDGGIGRTYPADPLGGRDANGPIFPIGPVDPRLPVQTPVIGVETPEGAFVAFPVEVATMRLAAGESVALGDVEVFSDGAGLRARSPDGDLVTHQSFWFAWSQFHPATALWQPELTD